MIVKLREKSKNKAINYVLYYIKEAIEARNDELKAKQELLKAEQVYKDARERVNNALYRMDMYAIRKEWEYDLNLKDKNV